MGVSVLVVDADRQSSLLHLRSLNQRLADDNNEYTTATDNGHIKPDKRYVSLFSGQTPWRIDSLDLSDADKVAAYIRIVREFDGIVLIDTPGSLEKNGIVPLLVQSDFLLCPFFYEMQTILSTAKFLICIDKLRKSFGEDMNSKLVLIPNRYRSSVGTRVEKSRIEQTLMTLRQFGIVSPDVKDTARIQHCSTLEFNMIQREACSPTFDFIVRETGMLMAIEQYLQQKAKL